MALRPDEPCPMLSLEWDRGHERLTAMVRALNDIVSLHWGTEYLGDLVALVALDV